MNKWPLIVLLLLLASCNQSKERTSTTVETIRVDVTRETDANTSDFVEKIELIPLHTDSNSIFKMPFGKLSFCKEENMYFIFADLDVFLFSADGKYIANSLSKRGSGPEDYSLVVDAAYNPFSGSVELFSPYGTIYRYDTTFQFKEKLSLNQEGTLFADFTPVGKDKYILKPVEQSTKDFIIYFCDYAKKEIGKAVSYEENTTWGITMPYESFFWVNGRLYFSPRLLNYYFYDTDIAHQTISPVLYLDFGEQAISKTQLANRIGELSNSSEDQEMIDANYKMKDVMRDYLMASDYPQPLIKLCNENYVYVYILQNQQRKSFIYNRQTQASYLNTTDSSFHLPYCPVLDENVLITLINPDELEGYIDRALLTPESVEVVNKMIEDGHPLIVRYYLK